MKSYAQNGEDVKILALLKGRIKRPLTPNGFYIDIGASDPEFNSVTKSFYDAGWNGINVEPVPLYFRKLQFVRYRDITLNAIVSDSTGTLDFYQSDTEGISSLNKEHAEYFMSKGYSYEIKKLQSTTLSEICSKYVTKHIDFLKIDVEGHEKQVLDGGDFKKYRPSVIVIETIKGDQSNKQWLMHDPVWDPYMMNIRYRFAYSDIINRYFVDMDEYWDFANTEMP